MHNPLMWERTQRICAIARPATQSRLIDQIEIPPQPRPDVLHTLAPERNVFHPAGFRLDGQHRVPWARTIDGNDEALLRNAVDGAKRVHDDVGHFGRGSAWAFTLTDAERRF